MTKIIHIIAFALAAGVLAFGLSACEKKEGPAERAGKQMDKAVESVGKKLEKTGEQIQDAARDAKK
ncbi:MAG: hypothetical protein ABI593_07055 [Betaproteobacteria bacterium]